MVVKKELKIAIAVIAALIILIWGINFLKSTSVFDKYDRYYAIYENIDGLKTSCSVVYRGCKVGQVEAIDFAGDNFDQIVVTFNVINKLRIPSNTMAKIASADLLGTKEIDLIQGDSELYAKSGDTLPSSQDKALLQQLDEQLTPIKVRAESIMNSIDTILISVEEIINDASDEGIKNSLRSVGRTLANLEHTTGTLDTILSDGQPALTSIFTSVDEFMAELASSREALSNTLANISDISDSLAERDIAGMIGDMLSSIDTITLKINTGSGTLAQLLNDDELYFNINAILSGLQTNPKRYINISVFGGGKEETKYGVGLCELDEPILLTDELYVKFPDLTEIHKSGKYYYITGCSKKLSSVEKSLERLSKEYPDAFIVKF